MASSTAGVSAPATSASSIARYPAATQVCTNDNTSTN